MDNKNNNIFDKRNVLTNKKSDDEEKLYDIKVNDEGEYVHGNKSKTDDKLEKYRRIVTTAVIGFMELMFLSLAFAAHNIIVTIFMVFIMLLMLVPIAQVYEKDEIVEVISKLYMIGFFSLWFGALGYATYNALKKNNIELALITTPFWLVGIIIVLMIIKRKK